MRFWRWLAASVTIAAAAAEPATQPAKIPAELTRMSDAYAALKSLSLKGTIELNADIDGQKADEQVDFAAAYSAPLLFRHEVPGDVIIAGTGQKIYLYLPAHNIYTEQDAPAGKFDDLSDDVRGVLWKQDISLALALSDNAARELLGRGTLSGAAEVTLDGHNCPAFTFSSASQEMTAIVNPVTHLLRRVVIDESRAQQARGANVKLDRITIDYAQTTPDDAVKPAQFAFTPPATADEAPQDAALALVGKPVPHFSLAQLDGAPVSDASLRGQVYVLDFWATWCGRCVTSLPWLDELYKRKKAEGLKVFAVNVQEDPDKIKDFVSAHALSLAVLLDPEGALDHPFGVDEIPQTVIVGRDGIVQNVFIVASDEQEKAIADAVANALSVR